MNRKLLVSIAAGAFLLLGLSSGLLGCGGGGNGGNGGNGQTGGDNGTETTNGEESSEVEERQEPGENWAEVSGTVFADGSPRVDKLKLSTPEACGFDPGMDGVEEHNQARTGENGELRDVIVWVQDLNQVLTGDEYTPNSTFMIDQNGCEFLPRTGVLQQGGEIELQNSDPTNHNFRTDWIDVMGTKRNVTQSEGDVDTIGPFEANGLFKAICNVHPWMAGLYRSHGNHAATRTDESGSFSLHLPPGTHTLHMQHVARAGNNDPQTVEVTVTENGEIENAGELEEIMFSF